MSDKPTIREDNGRNLEPGSVQKGAFDMRERAAKAVETFAPNIRAHSDEQAIRQQFRHQAATVIRALPLDPDTGGFEQKPLPTDFPPPSDALKPGKGSG